MLDTEPDQPGNLGGAIQAGFARHGGVDLERPPREAPLPGNPYKAIRDCLVESGGFDLEPMPREPIRDPPTFE